MRSTGELHVYQLCQLMRYIIFVVDFNDKNLRVEEKYPVDTTPTHQTSQMSVCCVLCVVCAVCAGRPKS
jgi:hypothetical protein